MRKRDLRRRKAVWPWCDDEETVFIYQHILSNFPARPVRPRRRHSREQVRAANAKHRGQCRKWRCECCWCTSNRLARDKRDEDRYLVGVEAATAAPGDG